MIMIVRCGILLLEKGQIVMTFSFFIFLGGGGIKFAATVK